MNPGFSAVRLIGIFFLWALLFVAVGPLLGLLALLAPSWFVFAEIARTPRPVLCEPYIALEFLSLPVFSPRPPPIR
jgi:hypothetical protein